MQPWASVRDLPLGLRRTRVNRSERWLTVAMTGAALLVAAVVVRREFARSGGVRSEPTYESRALDAGVWNEIVSTGVRIGPGGGRSIVAVFTDFECPACRGLHAELKRVQQMSPNAVEVRLLHLPLRYHRFALPAARLFECVRRRGDVTSFVDAIYEFQDSLGLLSWHELLLKGGASDPNQVLSCARSGPDSLAFPTIGAGLQLASRIDARGTPTVVIDGIQYRRPPSAETWDSLTGPVRE